MISIQQVWLLLGMTWLVAATCLIMLMRTVYLRGRDHARWSAQLRVTQWLASYHCVMAAALEDYIAVKHGSSYLTIWHKVRPFMQAALDNQTVLPSIPMSSVPAVLRQAALEYNASISNKKLLRTDLNLDQLYIDRGKVMEYAVLTLPTKLAQYSVGYLRGITEEQAEQVLYVASKLISEEITTLLGPVEAEAVLPGRY